MPLIPDIIRLRVAESTTSIMLADLTDKEAMVFVEANESCSAPLRKENHQALNFKGSFAAASACSMKGSIWLATAFTTGTTTLFPN